MIRCLPVLLASACARVFEVPAVPPDKAGGDDSGVDAGDGLDIDGDGVASSLDNCPHVANQAQTDTDLDAIGDTCDPRPLTGGDRMVSIDLFDGTPGPWQASPAAGWTMELGSWTSPAPGTVSSLVYTSVAILNEPTLQLQFELLDLGPESGSNRIVVMLDGEFSPGRCTLREQNHDGNISTCSLERGGAPPVSRSIMPEVTVSTAYSFRCARGAEMSWAIQGDGDAITDDVAYATPMTPRIEIIDLHVRVTSIAIYDIPD